VGPTTLRELLPNEHAVTFLAGPSAVQTLKDIRFLDANGTDLNPPLVTAPKPDGGVVREYYFPGPIASATIRLIFWSNVQNQQVPVKVKTRLGLSPVHA
jgi:hypothetical protein